MAEMILYDEKDKLLQRVLDGKIPISCGIGQNTYDLRLKNIADSNMYFSTDISLRIARDTRAVNLQFIIDNTTFTFSGPVLNFTPDSVTIPEPEAVYKNTRAYARVKKPGGVSIEIKLPDIIRTLNVPHTTKVDSAISKSFEQKYHDKSAKVLMAQISAWLKPLVDESRLVFFKNNTPPLLEERVIALTGKIVFVPSTLKSILDSDPSPQKHYVTEDEFLQACVDSGMTRDEAHLKIVGLLDKALHEGVASVAWVHIVFANYILGYVKIVTKASGSKAPVNFKIIEMLFQLCKVLGYSLDKNGYLGKAPEPSADSDIQIIDLSVSGFMGAAAPNGDAASLEKGETLDVTLKTDKRKITCEAEVVRLYSDTLSSFFGCRFVDMAPEDERFLFEILYGHPMEDDNADFIAGQ
jgi:hypothetical protein